MSIPEPYLDCAYRDPDCGCPIEEWVMLGVTVILHQEPNDRPTAWADCGDWDREIPISATDWETAKVQAFAWVADLPVIDGQ